MKKNMKRYVALLIVSGVLFSVLIVRLFDMQFQHGEEYYALSQNGKIKVLRLAGTRGTITDRNGIPLAYDQKSYNVEFVKDPSDGSDTYEEYTQSIRNVIRILEDNGIEVSTSFAIRKMEDGSLDFYWGSGISEEAAASREKTWREKMGVKSEDPPELLFEQLKKKYYISSGASYEEAYKILSVWQEVRYTRYTSYNPIVIAENVDLTVVAEIEMKSMELPGVQISESAVRVYPKQTMAAHIVGYIGRITDEGTMLRLEGEGYKRDDLIGISGIEATMESELTPYIQSRTGKQVIEVNSLGKAVRQTDLIKPESGNDVVLTIDLGIQKVLEEALEQNIKNTYNKQLQAYRGNQATYDGKVSNRGGTQIQLAAVGAAVVMSVQTGEILAMCSYPSYDPNVFTNGLSTEEYLELFGAGSNNPLFNNAISSTGAPGSIFKLVTALGGLMEGKITLDEEIDDKGVYPEGSTDPNAPHCWIYPHVSNHQNQNLERAIKNSCNYYFFTVADRLGIDLLNKWADLLGLTEKTGVELIGEKAGQMANQKSLYDPEKGPVSGTSILVKRSIKGLLEEVCGQLGAAYEDDVYEKVTLDLMALVNTGEPGAEIRRILRSELGIPLYYVRTDPDTGLETRLDWDINDFLNEIKWSETMTYVSGIGQSVTLLSPIGVARYISALVNGGQVYEATLIQDILTPEGESIMTQESNLVRDLGVPDEYLEAIKEGMKQVISGEDGTASDEFENFKYKEDIGGKTGTAQVSTIDLENNSWFVAFAPFDSPEIAVVVYIPHGYKGIYSAYTAQAIIEYYLDKENQVKEGNTVPYPNTIVP